MTCPLIYIFPHISAKIVNDSDKMYACNSNMVTLLVPTLIEKSICFYIIETLGSK